MFVPSVRNGKRGNVHRDKDGVSSPNWRGVQGGGMGGTKTDGTLGIQLSPKSVSAVFLMCTRL